MVYQLKAVADGIMWGGVALLPHGELLKKVISAAFNAPSSKVGFNDSQPLSFSLSSHFAET